MFGRFSALLMQAKINNKKPLIINDIVNIGKYFLKNIFISYFFNLELQRE